MRKFIAMYDILCRVPAVLLGYRCIKIVVLQCPECCTVLEVEAVDERNYPIWLKCLECDSSFDMDFLRQTISSA